MAEGNGAVHTSVPKGRGGGLDEGQACFVMEVDVLVLCGARAEMELQPASVVADWLFPTLPFN
jgi:hypothetical protein